MTTAAYTMRDYVRSLWWRLLLTAGFVYIVVAGSTTTQFWVISLGLAAMWALELFRAVRRSRASGRA